ncbi:MAG: hypothetical protein KDK70_43160 [Myxococcales bacterium]|nr:hypothetical protein [Myxococcales bacterium]
MLRAHDSLALHLCSIATLALGLLACGDDVDPIEPATTSVGATTAPTTAADSTTGPCVDGQEGCPCTPGGACDPGLQCLSDLCVDVGGTCPVGSAGCPCTMGGGCDPGLACTDGVCVDPRG